MKKHDIVLIVILSFGAIAVLFALAAYLYMRRRRRKRGDDEDGTSCAIRVEQSSDSGGKGLNRLNGFLNLKTPLISTKTLGSKLQVPLKVKRVVDLGAPIQMNYSFAV